MDETQLQELPDDITWIDSESSNIKRFAYSQTRDAVIVEFKGNTKTWQYAGPTAIGLFVGLQAAPSQGKFFFAHIRNNPELTATELKGESS